MPLDAKKAFNQSANEGFIPIHGLDDEEDISAKVPSLNLNMINQINVLDQKGDRPKTNVQRALNPVELDITHDNVHSEQNLLAKLQKKQAKGEENLKNELNHQILNDIVLKKMKETQEAASEFEQGHFHEDGHECHCKDSPRKLLELKRQEAIAFDKLKRETKLVVDETIKNFKNLHAIFVNGNDSIRIEQIAKNAKKRKKSKKTMFQVREDSHQAKIHNEVNELIASEAQMKRTYEELDKLQMGILSQIANFRQANAANVDNLQKLSDFHKATLKRLKNEENGVASKGDSSRKSEKNLVQDFMKANEIAKERMELEIKVMMQRVQMEQDILKNNKEIERFEKEIDQIRKRKLVSRAKLKEIYTQMLAIYPMADGEAHEELKSPLQILMSISGIKEKLPPEAFPKFIDREGVEYLMEMARLEKVLHEEEKQQSLNRKEPVGTQSPVAEYTKRFSKMGKTATACEIGAFAVNVIRKPGEANEDLKKGLERVQTKMDLIKRKTIQAYQQVTYRHPKSNLLFKKWEAVEIASGSPSFHDLHRNVSLTSPQLAPLKVFKTEINKKPLIPGLYSQTEGSEVHFRSESPENQVKTKKSPSSQKQQSQVYRIGEIMERKTREIIEKTVKKFLQKTESEQSLDELKNVLRFLLGREVTDPEVETFTRNKHVFFLSPFPE